jgi:GNAT superfamily N-acetyltransferase
MLANPTFSHAVDEDFDRLFALRLLVMREHLERVGRFDPARALARFRGSFRAAHTRLIAVDGAFAGCIALHPEAHGMLLEHFYLRPEYQGQGLGSRVLHFLLAETDAAGLPVSLSVLKGSPAARVYERHGFGRTGEDEWDIYYRRLPDLKELHPGSHEGPGR